MPPRKRKQTAAEQQQAAGEALQQPDRNEAARKIKEKLDALDRAGAGAQRARGEAQLSVARLKFAHPRPSPAPLAVEERCQAIAEAAQEIVDGFMQDFMIALKTGLSKQVRAARRCLLMPSAAPCCGPLLRPASRRA